MVARLLGTVGLSLAMLAIVSGCGTDAVGVDACRQVEEARCQQAPSCGISLEPPYSNAGTDVDACIRFYDTACLHGLASGNDPGAIDVNACVNAINNNGCSVVTAPETDPNCAWLIPPTPPSVPDASDATTDASDAGDGAPEEAGD